MSSSSSYCQGLQSCLEPPRLQVEPPRVLRLKLAPTSPSSKPNSSADPPSSPKPVVISSTTPTNLAVEDDDCEAKSNNSTPNADTGGWSFLQYLDNNNSKATAAAQDYVGEEKQNKVYVPPKFNRSSSALSGRSLEMCTESLGSETGSDGSEAGDVEMAMLSLENENNVYEPRERPVNYKPLTRRGVIMKRPSASFPPPLSSISGSTSVQMRPHREGGRLVLKAETVPSSRTNFQAERINGRLRIHLLRDVSAHEYSHYNEDQEQQEEEAVEEGRENTAFGDEGVDEEADDDDDDCSVEEYDWELEKGRAAGVNEAEMNLFPRRWCKEGETGSIDLLNWEPYWVAA
ncbi:hypothetical protein Tsubulata_045567 [Turnera subulata]|uniref:FAF domain-containing protein n=1 Tax=Turnera subulata TaxID=218843 RepID=A0A9Q0G4G0_9ROSI|nr:hypothetical protein Tsubulata_045567 [Turnera subulata]